MGRLASDLVRHAFTVGHDFRPSQIPLSAERRRILESVSRIYFPLRTSVELFENRESPAAPTRVKEAALLYDELIFEVGLLDVTITPNFANVWWTPPDQITGEMLEHTRRPVALGEPASIGFGAQPARGVPAEKLDVVISGALSAQYVAEFHTGILDELLPLNLDWIKTMSLGSDKNPAVRGSAPDKVISSLNFSDFRDKELLAETGSFERSFVYESFNRDSTVAASFAAAFNISPLFNPMVARRGTAADYPGSEALKLIVANVGGLPWEAVLEFRDHPGSAEARAKLREFEEKVAAEEPADALQFLRRIAQEVTNGYEQTVKELAPKLPQTLVLELAKTVISLVPGIGPVVDKAATAAEAWAEHEDYRRSWVSALMTLDQRPSSSFRIRPR